MNNRSKTNCTPLDQVPNKIYYSISEVSDFTGVEPHVLRYWETKFSRLNPKRVGGNQRKYTRNDLELLYEIVNLLYEEGFTLDGAERKLRGGLNALRAEREAERLAAVQPVKEPKPAPQNGQLIHEIKQELQSILKMLE